MDVSQQLNTDMEQTQDYTPENVRSCFFGLLLLPTLGLLALFGRCAKQDQGQPDITGVWVRTAPAIEYRFFDDSRFQQSDLPGEQWIWEQEAGTVCLYGNPERSWDVVFLSDTRARVVEFDTFEITRK